MKKNIYPPRRTGIFGAGGRINGEYGYIMIDYDEGTTSFWPESELDALIAKMEAAGEVQLAERFKKGQRQIEGLKAGRIGITTVMSSFEPPDVYTVNKEDN